MTRIYTPQPLATDRLVVLEKEPGVHLVKVLRMRSGEVRRFTLFEVRKREREAVREAIRRRLSAATSGTRPRRH